VAVRNPHAALIVWPANILGEQLCDFDGIHLNVFNYYFFQRFKYKHSSRKMPFYECWRGGTWRLSYTAWNKELLPNGILKRSKNLLPTSVGSRYWCGWRSIYCHNKNFC
jgi:hypothetical protein